MLFILFFSFVDWKYSIYQYRLDVAGNLQLVTKDVFNQAINKVKDECEGAAWGLIVELECCFPHDELMTAFGVIYPQLWATNPNKSKINVSHSLECVESLVSCALEGGWKWEVCFYIVFWLSLWFANSFF